MLSYNPLLRLAHGDRDSGLGQQGSGSIGVKHGAMLPPSQAERSGKSTSKDLLKMLRTESLSGMPDMRCGCSQRRPS